ncbi:MAG: ATP-dependent DNA helicase RecG [Saccharofermentans sp.]|nr:ATP-dependent DNA helicase RecG [Saccharofermentans sp.]
MSDTKVTLSSPVNLIYGVGPEAQKRLNKLDIYTVYDLLSYIPRRYNDWSNVGAICDYKEGEELSFKAVVSTSPARKGYKRTSPIAFYVSDGEGRMELSFFNSPYYMNKFQRGDEVFVHGTVSIYSGRPQMVNPYVEKADGSKDLNLVRPIYHLTAGITSASIAKWEGTALKLVGDQLKNVIPEELTKTRGLMSVKDAYRAVHFPKSLEEAQEGRRRIAYEELILLGMGMKYFMHTEDEEERAPLIIPPDKGLDALQQKRWKAVISNLGFELTDDQKKALRDIQRDLMSRKPMNRLVQGDVGAGKTAVAVLAMAMTAIMGKQAVLLAPTSVLAKQHYDSALSLLKGSDINIALLMGKTKASLKKEIKANLKDNTASVIIGTHAVLSDDVEFNDLGLVIADEQHRFGVKQREKLLISRKDKDDDDINSVHNLVMTATPIPRTLAMVVYGDTDTSIIKQKPAGRKEIKTNFLPSTDSDDLLKALKAKLASGEQAYIVCSKIDENDTSVMEDDIILEDGEDTVPAVSVMEMKKRLDESGLFTEYPSEVLYGSMKEDDKLAVMDRFLKGETKVLISTTVIEVGVNNPNANLMIIMNADRFGLSTLHQLRGRIGRGDRQAYCILASDSRSELALTRMKMMCESTDGFVLAQKDLELRGPGDFFGTRQHGIPQLRAANLFTDAHIAKEGSEAVKKVLDRGGSDAEVLLDNIKVMFDLRFESKMGIL